MRKKDDFLEIKASRPEYDPQASKFANQIIENHMGVNNINLKQIIKTLTLHELAPPYMLLNKSLDSIQRFPMQLKRSYMLKLAINKPRTSETVTGTAGEIHEWIFNMLDLIAVLNRKNEAGRNKLLHLLYDIKFGYRL